MKILIADDDNFNRSLLQNHLGSNGYEVIAVDDGMKAWEVLCTGTVQLAILDWQMPQLEGIEICEALMNNKNSHGIYIILLTACNERSKIVEAFQKGASDYIVKPYCKQELLARVGAGKRFIEIQAQLTQSQKLEAIGQLSAGIAHEINTPIQYIGDNTRFIDDAFSNINRLLQAHQKLAASNERGVIDTDLLNVIKELTHSIDLEFLQNEVPQATKQLLEGVERVTRIVRAMKEFSHPGSEEKQAIDINSALECTSVVSRNEWKYVADLVLDFDKSLPPVNCLPGFLNQVFLNLIVNAAHAIEAKIGKSSPTKGKITISTGVQDDYAEVRITDTGTGIPQNIHNQIFNPFFTTKPIGKGTGQGLAIVYSVITEKHGGTISFETEIDKGTTFIIRLPLDCNEHSPSTVQQLEESRHE